MRKLVKWERQFQNIAREFNIFGTNRTSEFTIIVWNSVFPGLKSVNTVCFKHKAMIKIVNYCFRQSYFPQHIWQSRIIMFTDFYIGDSIVTFPNISLLVRIRFAQLRTVNAPINTGARVRLLCQVRFAQHSTAHRSVTSWGDSLVGLANDRLIG
jgi:hypothetical protein